VGPRRTAIHGLTALSRTKIKSNGNGNGNGNGNVLDRSHAPRGNGSRDAPRHRTQSVHSGIPTRSVGTIKEAMARTTHAVAARLAGGAILRATREQARLLREWCCAFDLDLHAR